MKKEEVKCECCGKKLEMVFPKTRYCNSCAVYHTQTSKIITALKSRIQYLENKIYGEEITEKEVSKDNNGNKGKLGKSR